MTSQLRHFVAQRYVERPLLFEEYQGRKFHVRSYVLAVGALKVYVYRDMLALFAPLGYSPPAGDKDTIIDPQIHLTNSCLQSGTPMEDSVHRFWDLPSAIKNDLDLAVTWKEDAFTQIGKATSTLFEAAAREQMIHFQTLPNAFEVYGVDWMVDKTGNVWLLEVNAFPDFRQSGENLQGLVEGFWQAALTVAVKGFFRINREGGRHHAVDDMVKVLDIDLGRG
ncbi:MAG: hypothetical protein Q9164_007492 [Protoblastenia rupestris]